MIKIIRNPPTSIVEQEDRSVEIVVPQHQVITKVRPQPELQATVPEYFAEIVAREFNVQIIDRGPQGPPGSPGGPGDPGPPGAPGTVRYVHYQPLPDVVWTIHHDLMAHPTVFLEDQAGSTIYGSIFYVDNRTLTVEFRYAITGRANCV